MYLRLCRKSRENFAVLIKCLDLLRATHWIKFRSSGSDLKNSLFLSEVVD